MPTTESLKLPLADLVAHLHQAFPGDGVIHVGAGAGVGDMHCWRSWGITKALVVDANPQRSAWMEKEAEANPGWRCSHAVIGERDGDAAFFEASNPAESGLLDPDQLTPIWPVLRQIESKTVAAVTLDSLVRQHGIAWTPQWLIIDCLPATEILKGAIQQLESSSFVWVRTILDDGMPSVAKAGLAGVISLLDPYGLRLRAVQAGINPTVGDALFVRDWAVVATQKVTALQDQLQKQANSDERFAALHAETAELKAIRDQQAVRITTLETQLSESQDAVKTASQKLKECRSRFETLDKSHAEQVQRIEALQTERNALADSKLDLEQSVSELGAKKKALAKARDDEAKLAAERLAQCEAAQSRSSALEAANKGLERRLSDLETEKAAVARTLDEQTALAAKLAKEASALSIAKSDLEKRVAVLEAEKATSTKAQDERAKFAEKHKTEIDKLELTVSTQASRIRELELELAESGRRQQLFHEEMVRAEAQIDLIKDVLLREPGL